MQSTRLIVSGLVIGMQADRHGIRPQCYQIPFSCFLLLSLLPYTDVIPAAEAVAVAEMRYAQVVG